MSDPIERQDAIEVVKRQRKIAWENWHETRPSADRIIEDLKELPSAQPEIIRCGNCKHWTRTCGDKQWGLGDCDVFDKHLVMCNGYCAWAERREDGNQ